MYGYLYRVYGVQVTYMRKVMYLWFANSRWVKGGHFCIIPHLTLKICEANCKCVRVALAFRSIALSWRRIGEFGNTVQTGFSLPFSLNCERGGEGKNRAS